jgi:hypothetical protein
MMTRMTVPGIIARRLLLHAFSRAERSAMRSLGKMCLLLFFDQKTNSQSGTRVYLAYT